MTILTAEAREIIRYDVMQIAGQWADDPIETTIVADELQTALAVQAELAEHGVGPCVIVVRDMTSPPDRAVTIVHSPKNGTGQVQRTRCYLTHDHLHRPPPPSIETTQRAFERLALLLDRKHKAAPPEHRDSLDRLLHELAEYI